MDISEQQKIRPRLERLTNEDLLRLWDRLGIKPAANSLREDYLALDQEWLIGPIFADASSTDAWRALEDVEGNSA